MIYNNLSFCALSDSLLSLILSLILFTTFIFLVILSLYNSVLFNIISNFESVTISLLYDYIKF